MEFPSGIINIGMGLPRTEIFISGNLDIFQLEDLSCCLVTDSDTVFFDFLPMCYFGLGFVYTVEQEACWVGLHLCKSFSVLMLFS